MRRLFIFIFIIFHDWCSAKPSYLKNIDYSTILLGEAVTLSFSACPVCLYQPEREANRTQFNHIRLIIPDVSVSSSLNRPFLHNKMPHWDIKVAPITKPIAGVGIEINFDPQAIHVEIQRDENQAAVKIAFYRTSLLRWICDMLTDSRWSC